MTFIVVSMVSIPRMTETLRDSRGGGGRSRKKRGEIGPRRWMSQRSWKKGTCLETNQYYCSKAETVRIEVHRIARDSKRQSLNGSKRVSLCLHLLKLVLLMAAIRFLSSFDEDSRSDSIRVRLRLRMPWIEWFHLISMLPSCYLEISIFSFSTGSFNSSRQSTPFFPWIPIYSFDLRRVLTKRTGPSCLAR